MPEKSYESTVMRIAGNLLSGFGVKFDERHHDEYIQQVSQEAVRWARAIVAEVQRTAPKDEQP